ncbi:MAG TPA: hypothetical protein PK771_10255, partial [Spirochaetota bacterium]|nr:hypothetical protein [Spirochaetota bacterium]
MKKLLVLFILILAISCGNKSSFYDLDGANLNFFTIMGKNVLFQFNEPLRSLKIIFDENNSLFIKNNFPKANFIVSSNYFTTPKEFVKFETVDTSNNKSVIQIESPII